MRNHKRTVKLTANILLLTMIWQLIYPNKVYALTTGPSQPEVQSFEPVGTTDMVDMFTGDFVYNIPLLDVEGYPVNISYHGGVNMEQEASWVGLGWNINPGVMNRTVRGIPDDFKGDTLQKDLHIKDEVTLRCAIGADEEFIGMGDPNPFFNLSLGISAGVTFSNYRGMSADMSFSGGANVFHCLSAGVNIGVGSQTGASIDYSAGLSLSTSQIISSDLAAGVGINAGQGYSSRRGVSDLNFTISANVSYKGATIGSQTSCTVPIGIKNYVPVITNASTMNTLYGRIKGGGEASGGLIYVNVNAMYSKFHFDGDGSRASYGYLYSEGAKDEDILDFTRDKDGMFNKSMGYLPVPSRTYDIYSISGQGTGGCVRPFRNDNGSVYDPYTKSNASSESLGLEGALGDIFEVGGDETHTHTDISSGPWVDHRNSFAKDIDNSLFEKIYFKHAGELSMVSQDAGSGSPRKPRATLVTPLTAEIASQAGVNTKIVSYNSTDGFSGGVNVTKSNINRFENGILKKKSYHLSEFTQVQTDGRRYVYGIPAMNNIQSDVVFSVDPPSNDDLGKGLVAYSSSEDSKNNNKGRDNYYSRTITPSYAHSYLLTEVLSPDYVDVTGDGATNDDLGTFTKFNYTLKNNDYRWRAPITSGKAQYSPGFWSDTKDDKGSYQIGSREEWMLHSIETKNFVAEFYVSERNDGKGIADPVTTGGQGMYSSVGTYSSSTTAAAAYKLDSIRLYNKHDRFINTTNAVPIKTVMFNYDYSLCKGVPNTSSTNPSDNGKLTLKSIYVRYGNSDKSMISPYQFEYSSFNPNYDLSAKNRWGGYKPNSTSFTNYEYPFIDQNDVNNNSYASAWSLTKIVLPSGGVIQAEYESDDYAYVQNQRAAEMFIVQGVGTNKSFVNGYHLYSSKYNPSSFIYFKRRIQSETSPNFQDNYLSGLSCLYYNFNVKFPNGKNEPIKGYANIKTSGICPNDSSYGYVELKYVSPNGGGANVHPATYTALNVGRYNLPHIFFPGTDPDASDIQNILSGLQSAFDELIHSYENPIVHMLEESKCKEINAAKSFIRLYSPGFRKKGGGQRVKSLLFYDSWNKMAGGNTIEATYGKVYNYTVDGAASSGVASYEPFVGGDENPFRIPVSYTAQSGSNWPPNDPVDLYEELPIGESLFPPAVVGYSKVTTTSIHADKGRSSQFVDINTFYTAADYPIGIYPSGLDVENTNSYGLFNQTNIFKASQDYSFVFNDMHGKPRSNEHYVRKPVNGQLQLINSKKYNYCGSPGYINNDVKVVVYDPASNTMVLRNKTLAVESDYTHDSRQKKERTISTTENVNGNCFYFFIPILIPLIYGWQMDVKNEFYSSVNTSITQQYGILESVTTYDQGTTTTVRNEVYDPITGQPLVTSVNNEYKDKEFSTSYPAYWGNGFMGPGYINTGFNEKEELLPVNDNFKAILPNNAGAFRLGDELLLRYNYNGDSFNTKVWVVGTGYGITEVINGVFTQRKVCGAEVAPRFPHNTPGWNHGIMLHDVSAYIVRSGYRNQLTESMQEYTSTEYPFDGTGTLKLDLTNLINIKAREYSGNYINYGSGFNDKTNVDTLLQYVGSDSVNSFITGNAGVYKLSREYAYMTDRKYNVSSARTSGLFDAKSIWRMSPTDSLNNSCGRVFLMRSVPSIENNWKLARNITKWSPFGFEVENIDAIKNPTSALYGYNEQLPVGVAYNAKQGEILAEGFEDYKLLQVAGNVNRFTYSPFKQFFGLSSMSGGYAKYNTTASNSLAISSSAAHSGYYSLQTPSSANMSYSGVFGINLPVLINTELNSVTRYHLPFTFFPNKKYIISYWVRPTTIGNANTTYSLPSNGIVLNSSIFSPLKKTSNIIDGWQKVETVISIPDVPSSAPSVTLLLPLSSYIDDIRIFPVDANMKAYVYHPYNEKLTATLDENNFATFYEYDQEGNLVRTKKETEKGIITLSESRSSNPKH